MDGERDGKGTYECLGLPVSGVAHGKRPHCPEIFGVKQPKHFPAPELEEEVMLLVCRGEAREGKNTASHTYTDSHIDTRRAHRHMGKLRSISIHNIT